MGSYEKEVHLFFLYSINPVIMLTMKLCTQPLHILLKQVSQHFAIAGSNTATFRGIEELRQECPKKGIKSRICMSQAVL